MSDCAGDGCCEQGARAVWAILEHVSISAGDMVLELDVLVRRPFLLDPFPHY